LAVFGYVAIKLDCEPAPLILGFVLGPMMEENLRRALLISRGDPMVFVEEPISLAFLLVAAGLLLVLAAPTIRVRREEALKEEGESEDLRWSKAVEGSSRAPEQAGEPAPDHFTHQRKARDRLGRRRRTGACRRGRRAGGRHDGGGGLDRWNPRGSGRRATLLRELLLQAVGELIPELGGGR